jgi:peptidoglycan/xylan/chitin deacetylase (PgdA/CDA1 family)
MTAFKHSIFTRWFLRQAGDRLARRQDGPRLCVVNYHRILERPDPLLESEPDIATFRWQMDLLAGCFNVMPLYDALCALDAGRLPPRTVCITFDDGYRSVHDLALPVLREYGLPATVFVTSGHVGQGNMWNDRIIAAVQALPAGELDLTDTGLSRYPLQTLEDRKRTAGLLTEASKYLPPAARGALVERLAALAGGDLANELMLTPGMVVNLDRQGVEIGAHTVTHPILTSLDDAAARAEIRSGKEQLEAMIGKPVRLFAYPNGKAGKDFDARHVAMVREAGFEAAFTTAVGAITRCQDRFQLPRSRPWDRTPFLFGLRLLRWLGDAQPAPASANYNNVTARLAGQQKSGHSLPMDGRST